MVFLIVYFQNNVEQNTLIYWRSNSSETWWKLWNKNSDDKTLIDSFENSEESLIAGGQEIKKNL